MILQGVRKHREFLCFALFCTAFYITLALILMTRTNMYNITQWTNNDRFFSADDVYYSTKFFSAELDVSPRVIKHPLFIQAACAFTNLERLILGPVGIKTHYGLIIGLQIAALLMSLIFLYKTLTDLYKLKILDALLLLGIYAFSISTIIFTMVSESYIFSAAFLIVSFYCMKKQNLWMSSLFGLIAGGITITNICLWGAMLLFCPIGDNKSLLSGLRVRIAFGAATVLILAALIWVLPVGRTFYANLSGFRTSPQNYRDHFRLFEAVKYIFFAFFGSSSLYINTVLESPFGELQGRAISFIPSAGIPVIILMFLWTAILAASIWKNKKEPLLWTPAAALAFNLILHGVIQYGLKEAFLFTPHHLFAQIFIAALFFRNGHKYKTAALAMYFIGIICINAAGFNQLRNYILTF